MKIGNSIDSPLVTVVMCTYNTHYDFFRDAVLSILNQTYKNFELIIVDDHSDSILNYDFLNNNHIRIIRNSKNMGPSYSRNVAIRESNAKYIAIMDADDISLPERLEKQVKFMESNIDVVACGTWFNFFGDKNHVCKICLDDQKMYKASLLFGNSPTLRNPSVMIRKSVLIENNIYFDENLRNSEDYMLWTQLIDLGRIVNLPEVLLNYRVHSNQATSVNKDLNLKDWNMYVIEKLLKKLDITLNAFEKTTYKCYKFKNAKSALTYWRILEIIKRQNKKLNIYNQDSLIDVCYKNWQSKILHTKNPFIILRLLFSEKEIRCSVFKIEKKRLIR